MKRILIAGAVFIGFTMQAAEVVKSAQLPQIEMAIEKYLPKEIAQMATDYVDCIEMSFYPTEFEQFCKLDKYRQQEIIAAFGMVHPRTECARILRRQISAAITLTRLDRVPVSIFNGKKDQQLVCTTYGECLGRIEQVEHSYSWPDLQKAIAWWRKKTKEIRAEEQLSHDEL